jgi:hypothetical protein
MRKTAAGCAIGCQFHYTIGKKTTSGSAVHFIITTFLFHESINLVWKR